MELVGPKQRSKVVVATFRAHSCRVRAALYSRCRVGDAGHAPDCYIATGLLPSPSIDRSERVEAFYSNIASSLTHIGYTRLFPVSKKRYVPLYLYCSGRELLVTRGQMIRQIVHVASVRQSLP